MKNTVTVCLIVSMTCVAFAQLSTQWTDFQPIQSYPFIPFPYSVSPPSLQTNDKPGAEAITSKQFGPYSSLVLGSHVNCLKKLKEETDALVEKIKVEIRDDILRLQMEMEEMKRLTTTMKEDFINLYDARTEVAILANELEVTKEDLSTTKLNIENLSEKINASTSASSIGKIPSSCDDLQTIGHKKSGIYSVKRKSKVESLYCDFTKQSGNTDFEKSIGYVDVKSTLVYFHAQRTGKYGSASTGIPFNKIGINVGKALDASTGVFVAPVSGKYFFAFSGLCWDGEAKIQLQTKTSASANWTKIGDAHSTSWNALAIQSTLQLAKGDQVRIILIHGIIHDADGNNFSNYNGWLLEQDVV